MPVAAGEGGERHAAVIIIGPHVQAPLAGRAAARLRSVARRVRGRRQGESASSPTETPAPAAETGCEKVPAAKPKDVKVAKPTEKLKKGKTYVARVLTNCGEFDITLDPARAPRTGGSFKTLVDKRFYDGLSFHRIVAGFVIQGGDPEGDGNGGPGYQIVEPPPQDLTYSKGVVAMAKAETEPGGHVGEPVLRRHRRGRRAAARLRAARQGHEGPGRRRQDRRRRGRAGREAAAADRHPPDPHHRILSAISAPPAATPPAASTAASKPGPSTSGRRARCRPRCRPRSP